MSTAAVGSILRVLRQAKDLVDSIYSAEKTKVPAIKSQANEIFQNAYQQFQYFRFNINSIENKSSDHYELILTTAETAFITENPSISRELIEEYLLQSPQQDSFYCRAKILLGLLIDLEASSTYGEVNIRQRKLALNELNNALNVAMHLENKDRYQFLLFNISIESWKIIRQFLRKGRAKYFKEEMIQFCQAIEGLKDIDKSWLITFYSGTAYCCEDAEDPKKALELLDKALLLAEELVSDMTQKEVKKYEQLTGLSKQIDEVQKLIHVEDSNHDEKKDSSQETESELVQQLHQLQKQLVVTKDEYKDICEKKVPLQDRVMKLYFQKIYSFPSEGKKLLTLPQITQSLRMKSLTTLHLMCAGCMLPNEYDAAFKGMMNELDTAANGAVPTSQTPSSYYALLAETYFDISRTARHLGGRKDGGYLREVSNAASTKGRDLVRTQNILTPLLLVKQDLCSAVLSADNCQNYAQSFGNSDVMDPTSSFGGDAPPPLLTESQIEGYTLNSRLEAIKLLERILSVCQNRIKDDYLIQEICLEIWNVLYPLIQSSLRKQIHRTLQLLSTALSDIDSPLYRLRCQVAYELSKCEENVDFVVKAYQEGVSALEFDYGELNNLSQDFIKSFGGGAAPTEKKASPRGKGAAAAALPPPPVPSIQPIISRHENPGYDSDRKFDVLIAPYVDILHLRASVYDTPDSPEDQVILNLQQIRESSSKRYKKDLLSKSSQTMFDILKSRERENTLFFDLNDIENEQYAVVQQELLAKQEQELKSRTGHVTTVKASSVGNMVLPLQMIDLVLEKFIKSRPVEEVKIDAKGNPIPNLQPDINIEKMYTPLTKAIQKRVYIMSTIADVGHVSQHEIYKQAGNHHGYVSRKDAEYRVELSYIVEKSLMYILTHTWKPKDFMFHKLIVGQVDALCKLAESLINRLDGYHVNDEDLMIVVPHSGPLPVRSAIAIKELANPGEDDVLPPGTVCIDPRSMGIIGKLPTHKSAHSNNGLLTDEDTVNPATTAMLSIKQAVIRLFIQALTLAMDSIDVVCIQNVMIYFWNIHLHVFKYNLYHLVLDEFHEFLELSLKAFDLIIQSIQTSHSTCGKSGLDKVNFPTVDYKLQANILEVYMLCQVSKGNIQGALDVGLKGCNHYKAASIYSRRRICELVSKLSIVGNAVPASSSQPAKGAAKKGPGAATTGDIPLPTFDNPILSVISQLVALEVTTSESFLSTLEDPNRYQSLHPAIIEKSITAMKTDVINFVNELTNRSNEIGEKMPLSQEENDEVQEMLVSCWARLTRANLKQRNIYSTNDTANECMLILNKGITQSGADVDVHDFPGDRKMRIHKRVWRWASLCSRYMGLAISHLIHGEGQEKELQNELRLASLRHFTVSAQFGENAEYNDLILFPAIDAWNVFLPLVDEICQTGSSTHKKKLSNSLIHLQRSILKCLLSYRISALQNQENEEEEPSEDDPEELIHVVKLNYYLAIIEELAQQLDWKTALEVVMESFDNVPSRYQKPLWKWRVIVMSKRGKNVLDGLQKLKETDVILQARVFAILARNSSKPSQQLEAYQKTVEILAGDLNRVEYMLEIAQWISSSGLPTNVAYDMVQGALDSLYEIEEACLADEIEPLHDGTVSESSRSQKTGKPKSQASRGSISRRGSAMIIRSRQGSKQSLKSEKLSSLMETQKLNLKQLDQAIRGVSMLCLLESVTEMKCNRALEVIFFIERSLLCWQGVLEQICLPDELSSSCRLPTNPINLLTWIPSQDFVTLTKKCQDSVPLFVPSPQSLPSLQLTFHYLSICSEVLEQNGYLNSAALCLAWMRCCVMFGASQPQVDILLVILYYKSVFFLSKAQIFKRSTATNEGGIQIPEQLGFGTMTVTEVVRKIGYFDPAQNHTSSSEHERSTSSYEEKDDLNSATSQSVSTNKGGSQRSKRTRRPSTTPIVTAPLNAVLTYTKEYSMSIDNLSYDLILCDLLINIGHFYRAKKIASYVYYSCNLAPNHRLKMIASRILSELNYLAGNYTEALYLTETSKIEMNESSDMKELSKQIQTMMSCYLAMNNLSSASALMNNTIQLFSTVAAKQSQSASRKSVGFSSTKTFPTETTLTSTHKGSTQPMVDLYSYATLEGYVSVATEFMNHGIVTQLSSTLKLQTKKLAIQQAQLSSRVDSLTADRLDSQFIDFTALTDLFQRVSLLLTSTSNQRSILYTSLLSSYCQCVFRIVHLYYTSYTKNISAGEADIFGSWIDSNLRQIEEYYEESVNIANGLQNRIPLGELMYTLHESTSNVDRRVVLTTSPTYEYLRLQLQYWEVLAFHHMYKIQNTNAPVQIVNTSEMNPVEKYLDAHRPSTATKSQLQNMDSLSPSLIDKCVNIGSAVTQSTTLSSYESLERYVMYYAAQIGQKIEKGELHSTLPLQWFRQPPTDDLTSETAQAYQEHRKDDIRVMQLLESYLLKLLFSETKNSLYSYLPLSHGSYYLLEAAGRHTPSVSSFYQMTYQNIVTREWVYHIWKDCLNPGSEINQCLQRVEYLSSQAAPVSGRTQERLHLEYEFLKSSSPIWNKLNIVTNPKEILSSPFFTQQTCVISLQFCPMKRTLYVSAGYPKVTKAISTPSDLTSNEELPGSWFANKLFLDEQQRRTLHHLSAQYQRWIEGTSKFISTYGEGLVESMDYEGYSEFNESIAISESMRNLMKAEHAIEEEFTTLLNTFSTILQPLFGIGGELDQFLEAIHQQLLSAPPPAPATGKGSAAASAANSSTPATVHNVILLIGDELLQHLPFEALPLVQSRFHGQLSRDFSLNTLGNRLKSLNATDVSDRLQLQSSNVACLVDPFDDDPSKNSPASASQTEAPTETIPEPDKKNVKNTKGSAAPAVTAAPVVQDAPYSAERPSMVQVISKLQQLSPATAGKWQHVITMEKRGRGVALQDWISMSSRETGSTPSPSYEKAIFVYSPGKFLGTLLNPREFCHFNLRNVSLLFIADGTHTDLSFRRQLTLESKKSPEEIALETPLVCQIMSSLTGIGCTVSSLWYTPATALEKQTVTFWKEFMKGTMSVNQAVRRGREVEVEKGRHRVMHEVGLSRNGNGDVMLPPPSEEEPRNGLRKWMKYSRVIYGIPNIYYQGGT